MSSNGGADAEEADEVVCANCGKAAVDNIKLKICTACKLVKYCSIDCQRNHRKQHKKACKKRMAEIRDDKLFTQPDESHYGECPICCLPLPLDDKKSGIYTCCGKRVCYGCSYANQIREMEQGLAQRCPYCRELVPGTVEEMDQNRMKRVKAKDPVALFQMGAKCHEKGDFEGAVEYYTKAAALGNMNAHHSLSIVYRNGQGGDEIKKYTHHMEEAAIGGHPDARVNLGANAWNSGRYEIAVKHYIIAANLGDNEALERVKEGFARGYVSKENYEAALRGHQAAIDATKSEQRDAAQEYYNSRGNQY
jgi:hypothetical protein